MFCCVVFKDEYLSAGAAGVDVDILRTIGRLCKGGTLLLLRAVRAYEQVLCQLKAAIVIIGCCDLEQHASTVSWSAVLEVYIIFSRLYA
jgi:hypothetical protein